MSDFEKLINASDLIGWIIKAYPDWCVGAIRGIVDHINELPSSQPEQKIGKWTIEERDSIYGNMKSIADGAEVITEVEE